MSHITTGCYTAKLHTTNYRSSFHRYSKCHPREKQRTFLRLPPTQTVISFHQLNINSYNQPNDKNPVRRINKTVLPPRFSSTNKSCKSSASLECSPQQINNRRKWHLQAASLTPNTSGQWHPIIGASFSIQREVWLSVNGRMIHSPSRVVLHQLQNIAFLRKAALNQPLARSTLELFICFSLLKLIVHVIIKPNIGFSEQRGWNTIVTLRGAPKMKRIQAFY